jgi:pimeloyl-ACP methyl ester carboxylesterase
MLTQPLRLGVQFSLVALLLSPAGWSRAAQPQGAKGHAPFAVKVVGSGRPMLLIPGLCCGADVWDGTVAHFKDRYECHVLTLAGFAGQPSIDGPFIETMRDGIIRYIADKKLDLPVIVGHSIGGTLAFAVAAKAPDKVGPIVAVDGVPCLSVLMDPTATPENVKPFAEKERDRLRALTPEEFAAENRQALMAMITDPKEVKRVAASCSKSDRKAFAQAFYELLLLDLRMEVKAIRSPVLLIGSTALLPADEKKKGEERYRAQVAAVPKCKVIFGPRARHFIQLDEPEFFFREVAAFLKEEDRRK